MFLTFSAPAAGADADSPPAPKRTKVSQACEGCRLYRVRCDGNQRCSQCIDNKRECVFLLPKNRRRAVDSQPEGDAQQKRTKDSCSSNSQVSVFHESSRTSTQDNFFASKVDAYFSSISSLIYQPRVEKDPPRYTPIASSPYEIQLDTTGVNFDSTIDFTRSQTDAFLHVYWNTYHDMMPVVDRDDFKLKYEALWDDKLMQRHDSPLVDAMLALSIQHAYCSGSNERVLGLRLAGLSKGTHYTLIGTLLIQRCQKLLDPFAFEETSVLCTIQCYLVMSVYLLNATQGRLAYGLLGSAVRLAYILGLNKEAPVNMSKPKAELRRNIWWLTLHLDFRCSKQLGLPGAIQIADVTLALPEVSSSRIIEQSSSYYAEAIKLSAVALTIWERLRLRETALGDSISEIESRADALKSQLSLVYEWARDVKTTTTFMNIDLDFLDTKDSQKNSEADSSTDRFFSNSIQHTLLRLQYHDVVMGLCRQFVNFPKCSFTPRRSPLADDLATDGLKHALTITKIIYDSLLFEDLLYGWSEVYLWQWNAALTALGFMLAHPTCHWFAIARASVLNSIQVFELVERRQPAAEKAKIVTRDLCQRIDDVVEFCHLRSRSRSNQGVLPTSINTPISIEQGTSVLSQNCQGESTQEVEATDKSQGPSNHQEQGIDDFIEPNLTDGNGLWAWEDIINTDDWFGCQTDLVEGLLADMQQNMR